MTSFHFSPLSWTKPARDSLSGTRQVELNGSEPRVLFLSTRGDIA